MLIAHGLGTRTDLPIPVTLAAVGAGLAVLISFAVLGSLWREPRLGGAAAGRPLPDPVIRALDSPLLRRTLRLAATLAAATVVVVGLLGPDDPSADVAPWALFITFWVGLVRRCAASARPAPRRRHCRGAARPADAAAASSIVHRRPPAADR